MRQLIEPELFKVTVRCHLHSDDIPLDVLKTEIRFMVWEKNFDPDNFKIVDVSPSEFRNSDGHFQIEIVCEGFKKENRRAPVH